MKKVYVVVRNHDYKASLAGVFTDLAQAKAIADAIQVADADEWGKVVECTLDERIPDMEQKRLYIE